MNVKAQGSGCEKCKLLYAEVEKAVAQVAPAVELEKVEKIAEIVSWLRAAGAKQG